jgi:hypothetical protein
LIIKPYLLSTRYVDEPLDFAVVQAVDCAAPRAWWLELESAPDLFDDVLGLVVGQVVFAPDPQRFDDGVVERLRLYW